MIISGTATDPSLVDEVKVTVIATGATDEAEDETVPADIFEPEKERTEVVGYKEWIEMQSGLSRNAGNVSLTRRNSTLDEDLGIPTVFRSEFGTES